MKKLSWLFHRAAMWAVGALLYAAGRLRFRVRILGLGGNPPREGLLITNNHQLDWDIVLLAPAVFFSWRRWKRIDRLSFAASEKLFNPGYIYGRFLDKIPAVNRFFFYFNVGPAIRYLNARPIRHLRDRTFRAVLSDVLGIAGNLPIHEVMKPGWEKRFPHIARAYFKRARQGKLLSLKDCMKFKMRVDLMKKVSHDELDARFKNLVQRHNVSVIKESLEEFAAMVEKKHPLYFSVEGRLTPDGRFDSIRAGLARILEKCGRATLLPVHITYDYMQGGRYPVYLNFGKPVTVSAGGMGENDLKSMVIDSVDSLYIGTVTSLLALVVKELAQGGTGRVAWEELLSAVKALADICLECEYTVDSRLLSRRGLEKSLKRALEWGERKGLWTLKREGDAPLVDLKAEKVLEEKEGPWPNVNYITYAANHVPRRVYQLYLGKRSGTGKGEAETIPAASQLS